MIKIHFSEQAVTHLRHASIDHPHPRIRRKATALLLKSQEIPHHAIGATLGISGNTLRQYMRDYLDGGLDKLTTIRFKGSTSELAPFEKHIRNYVEQTPPHSIRQARHDIATLTGISLSKEQVRRYLRGLGVRCRKVSGVPARADIAAQEEFKKMQLDPRLQEAEDGLRKVYFVDAAHFVLGAFLTYVWSFVRVFVRTPSGRQRYNVLGALDAITKELSMVTNNTYITATEVCELLRKISANTSKPVTVVLDNARYQRCKLVMALAAELKIELLFLPPYSPNFNLIERLWKLTKKEVLNSKYHADFDSFRTAISGFLETMHKTHASELKSLLTLNFQTFTKEQVRLAA